MKIITILLVTVFLNACGGSKEVATNAVSDAETEMNKETAKVQNDDMIIEYTEQTRGFYKMIRITPEMVSSKFKHDGAAETRPCNKSLWSSLMIEMNTLNLKQMPELEAPSKAFQFDGAAMANLTITKDGQTYTSATFDAGKPHDKIASLISEILASVDKKD